MGRTKLIFQPGVMATKHLLVLSSCKHNWRKAYNVLCTRCLRESVVLHGNILAQTCISCKHCYRTKYDINEEIIIADDFFKTNISLTKYASSHEVSYHQLRILVNRYDENLELIDKYSKLKLKEKDGTARNTMDIECNLDIA